MKIVMFAALAALCSVSPAIAQEAPAPAEPPKSKKVCRLAEQETGTLIAAHKTCHTAAEWREIEAHTVHERAGRPVPPNVNLDALVVR